VLCPLLLVIVDDMVLALARTYVAVRSDYVSLFWHRKCVRGPNETQAQPPPARASFAKIDSCFIKLK
jgi:hypothetical protein